MERRTGRPGRSSWCSWLPRALPAQERRILSRGLLPLSQSLSSTVQPGGWSGRHLQAFRNAKTGKTSIGEGPRQGQGLRDSSKQKWDCCDAGASPGKVRNGVGAPIHQPSPHPTLSEPPREAGGGGRGLPANSSSLTPEREACAAWGRDTLHDALTKAVILQAIREPHCTTGYS